MGEGVVVQTGDDGNSDGDIDDSSLSDDTGSGSTDDATDDNADDADDGDNTDDSDDSSKDAALSDAEKVLQKELDERDQEILGLRQLTRDNKRTMDGLNTKITNMDEVLRKANLISEEDDNVLAKQKEEFSKRTLYLENIQEVMRVNPKYEDVDQVISQANFDDIIQAMAETYVEEDPSLKLNQVVMELEDKVWSLPNPYKYMYDLIKNNHPTYTKVDNAVDVDKAAAAQRKTNLGDLPGGGSDDLVGWSTTKIDKMDEDELSKVPTEVYTKYMQGTLK